MKSYIVKPVNEKIAWDVTVPGSKSITNRALLMASLCDEPVKLTGVLFSDDSRYFLSCLQTLGYDVDINEAEKTVVIAGSMREEYCEIYVGSAGTAARFLTAMLGVSSGKRRINASDQMKKRPMKPLFQALISLGARIEFLEEEWHLPVDITGADELSENLELDISDSTQFLSAFQLIGPMFQKGLKIDITSQKKIGSYIKITMKMVEQFGSEITFDGSAYFIKADSRYKLPTDDGIQTYHIEPDMSAACYFYGAAAINGGTARVKGITSDCMQGDYKFLEVLEKMGCTVEETAEGVAVTGPEDKLAGITADMNDFADQALTLAAIAPYASSPVEINGIAHIRKQESDRLHAMVVNLNAAGIKTEEREDGITIYPGSPKPCSIETFDDHRVAMSFAIMGLQSEGIEILNPMCCKKTFENFFELLDKLN